MRLARLRCCLVATLALLALPLAAQETGVIAGTLTDSDDEPLNGVTVTVGDLGRTEISNADGRFRIAEVPVGTYDVTFQLGDNMETVSDVEVAAGETTELTQVLPWELSFAETVTVYSASRRRERIVEAPASIALISEDEIASEAAHGQLAKALEFTPGADVTQSGLYDFNVNTRGFNSSLNRRVPVLVDGRDPSVPFLMSVDWPSLSSLGDVATMELVRGPSSALYGTNAFNGVLNITTKQPRFSRGGRVQLVGGEPSTTRGDLRWAGELGGGFYLKGLGSYTDTEDFYVARTPAAGGGEYAGLPVEAVPPATFEDELSLANVRLDKYIGENVLTVEGGTSSVEGPVLQTGIGRVQVLDQDRPYARVNASGLRYNVLAWYNERDAPEQLALSSGTNLVLDSEIWSVEGQVNTDFADQKGRVVVGGSYRDEEVRTEGTLTLRPVGAEREAVYAQVDYNFTDRFKAVGAARWDDSSLHDSQLSPKAGLVYSPTPNQTLRLTYNEAFQSPNYSEFFLAAPAGPVQDLSPVIRAIEAGAGLPPGSLAGLGFSTVPIVARGNDDLEVEEITSWEVGYSGIIGGDLFVTLDYYNSELEGFVTDLLPGVNPSDFPPYMAPIPQPLVDAIRTTLIGINPIFAGLTNEADGSPAVVLSYTNAGAADTQGVDLGINWYVTPDWTLDVSYSWFDFDLQESLAADQIEPNAPEHKYSLGLSYGGERWDGSIGYRWVDDFQWAAGVFAGPVPSYEVVNLVANYHITDWVGVGVNVSNVLDDEHYEAFGGDLLERRALGQVTFTW